MARINTEVFMMHQPITPTLCVQRNPPQIRVNTSTILISNSKFSQPRHSPRD
jgi:hypothetical protein